MKRILMGLFFCIIFSVVASEKKKKYKTMEYPQCNNVTKIKNPSLYDVYKKKNKIERGSIQEFLFFCNTLGPYTSGIPITLEGNKCVVLIKNKNKNKK